MIRRTALLLATFLLCAPTAFSQYFNIIGLQPPSALQGTGPVTLTITTTNSEFVPSESTTVYWNNTQQLDIVGQPTGTQVVVTIPASLLTQPGVANIYIVQGQLQSSSASFQILPNPKLTSMSPNSAVAGSSALTLTVFGSNIPPGAGVTWNGATLGTTFVNSSQLTALVPAALLANAGTALVNITAQSQSAPLTFTINPAPMILNNILPTTIQAGSPAFILTLNGSGFTSASTVTWDGAPLITNFQIPNQLTATVPSGLITTPGTVQIEVTAPGQTSPPTLPFVITPRLALTSLSPNSAIAGGPAFTLTINGTGFTAQTGFFWNAIQLPTTFIGANQVTASVPGNLLTQTGTASITAQAFGFTSNALPFSITAPPPLILSQISPNTALAGSSSFTLTATGSGFSVNTLVTWNGLALSTNFVSATQLAAAVPSNLISSAGTVQVGLTSTAQTSPPTLPFVITPPLTLTSLAPNTAVTGSAAFNLTANGAGFTNSTFVTWNGQPLTTTFLSTTQLSAAVPASLIATAATASVGVAVSGQTSPPTLSFVITPPQPSITTLSPPSTVAGGPTFTLTIIGAGFTSTTTVSWNSTLLSSVYINSGQLTATVPASLIAQIGTPSITAQNGNLNSNAATFTINAPPLTLSSVSPTSAAAGGLGLTLTVGGSGFSGNTTVTWNGSPLTTAFGSATQLTATVPASLIAAAATVSIGVSTPGQASPATLPFVISQPTPTLTSLSPNSAGPGGNAFTLTINGTGFIGSTIAYWNGQALASTLVSATQLSATIPAGFIAQSGSASVTAQNGTQTSNALTFTIGATPLTLTNISPNTVASGGPAFTLTVTGSGYSSAAVVTWNGSPLSTTFVSATQLTAIVPAALIATGGNSAVSISATGQTSPAPLSFIVTQTLTLSSLSPSSASAGSAAFTLSVNGAGFTTGTSILWNGSTLPTTVVSASQLTAPVSASLIAQAASATITAQNGSATSNALTFSITAPPVILSGVSPNSAAIGSLGVTIGVSGSGFPAGTFVTWNGSPLSTTYVSASQLSAVVPASFLTAPQTAAIGVSAPSQPASLPFLVTNALILTSVSPSKVFAGGPAFTLTAFGAGFTGATAVTWNGTPLSTTFVSTAQLTAAVPAALIVNQGRVAVDVTPSAGQTSPAPVQLVIAPNLVLSGISPTSAVAGGPAFTLTATGSGFDAGASITWNNTALPTTFVSSTQLTASVGANLVALVGNASVGVASGDFGAGPIPFAITPPAPTITSVSPASVPAGGPAVTINVTGTGFVSGAGVSANGTGLSTSFVNISQVTAVVPASLTAQPGSLQISLTNPTGQSSNAVTLTVTASVPTITSISPTTVLPGGPAFSLTVTGTGFSSGASVSFNGMKLNTSFISSTQLIAAVTADLIANAGVVAITASNTGTASSNAVNLSITTPVPSITSLTPAVIPIGAAAFTLNVTGSNFVSGATVYLGTTPLTTTFVSSTQLSAAVPANLVQQPGPTSVTVTNPGSLPSNALQFIVAAAPTITSISPSTVTAGGPSFTLTINGTNFVNGALVMVGPGNSISTTFVNSTQLTTIIPASLIALPGTLRISIPAAPNLQSNAVILTIAPAGPALTSITPVTAKVGDPTFKLSLTGSGFVRASIAQWNGAPLATTYISSTQLTAVIDAGRLILPATASVTVANPSLPDGTPQISNSLTFTINPVTPAISSLSQTSATAGDPAFSLTITGSGFLSLTVLQWNTTSLTTHFVSPTQVTADVPATLLSQAGTATITAVNPGNNLSAAFTFTINPRVPAITSLSKTSATAGDAAFTLTVTGTGFSSASLVNFGTNTLATTFVSSTQLTGVVTANLLLLPNTFQIVVQQGSTASNAVPFTINLPAPPSLRLNPPTTALPAVQPSIDFGLNTSYPIPLTGTVTLTFVSNATVPSDDPSIQFAAGGRTFNFTAPANSTTLPALLIQTGTVAGVITLKVTLTAAGIDVTPATGSSATITVAKSAPVIRKITLTHASGSLEIDISGFSTTRDMTTAVFQLTGAPGSTFTSSTITVPVSTLFTSWFQSSGSTAFGSQFTYAQPFTVVGDTNAVTSVTVALTNSAGSVTATSN